jgi:hypothetical protein
MQGGKDMDTAANVQMQAKEKYGSAARAMAEPGGLQACCDPGLRCCDPITTKGQRINNLNK